MKKTNLQAETAKSRFSSKFLSELAENDTRTPANYDKIRQTFLRKPNSIDLDDLSIRIDTAFRKIAGTRTSIVCECGFALVQLRDGSDQDNAFVCPCCGLRFNGNLEPNE
ncbi:MAG: hypothetical protein WC471_03780 [Candidatus Woesearchaeota archaeon]